jgi:PAS domain S-box-containing protein
MTNFSPSAVLVNRSCDILYISGGIEDFLIPPTGVPKFNLLSMARPNIKMELTSCVRKAYSENKHCKYEKLKLKAKDSENTVTIHAIPVSAPASMKGLMVVAFESTGKRPVKQGPGVDLIVHPEDLGDRKRAEQLEHELSSTKEYLKTTIEELETSNEELKSTNEELQSSNEELQSTNEELQTSKEELQSMNEELTTVNTELENKIEELSKANDDVNNLMSSSKVGVAFFDSDLNLKRYTPAVTNIINVLPSDLGRPLSHLTTNIQYDNLLKDVEDTARTLEDKEIETKADDGSWYLVRIAPYKTTYKSFEGVVVTFVDCTEQKRAEIELSEHRERLELTLWGADLALWDVYINSGEVHFNSQWAEMLGYGADELTPEIQTWRKLVHEDDISTVIKDWNAHLNGETPLFETKYRLKTKSGAYKWIMARGKVSQWDQEGKALRATGVFLDLSAPKAAEDAQMRTISDIEQKTEVLKEALSISPDHFHLYDLYGRCLYANESALTSLDLTSDQLVGKTVWDLSSKIDVLKDFDKRLEEILSTGDDIEGETYYRNTEGVSRFLYVFKPIRDRENNIVSVLAAYRKT